jgi:hypothetical protein
MKFKDPFLGHLGQRWLVRCIQNMVYQMYREAGLKPIPVIVKID